MLQTFKRLFDFCGALLGIIIFSPLFILISFLIKITSSGPVFFRQDRAGKDGAIFRLYKFRSMINNADKIGPGLYLEENDPRITWVGRLLRASSLDELPQLINILKGEMSIVGPRPTLPYQVEKYSDYQRLRLLMRPGLTGWAQVNGRNSLTWPEKIELDVWYIKHWSLKLDLIILFRTFSVVFRREGIMSKDDDEISRLD